MPLLICGVRGGAHVRREEVGKRSLEGRYQPPAQLEQISLNAFSVGREAVLLRISKTRNVVVVLADLNLRSMAFNTTTTTTTTA